MPTETDHLKIDFGTEPFTSVPKLLARSVALYFGALPGIAAITLLVFLPAKFLLWLICSSLGMQEGGVTAYAVSGLSDFLLGSLVAPAVVYLLVGKLRSGRAARLGDAFRWGRRLWGRSLWNEIKMEVTVMLWGLLLVIPGVVAAVRLTFTDVIVGVEGWQTEDVLARSRELVAGRWWKVAMVLLVVGVVQLAALMGVYQLKLGMTITDSLLAVVGQWMLAAELLMYLGITGEAALVNAGNRFGRRYEPPNS